MLLFCPISCASDCCWLHTAGRKRRASKLGAARPHHWKPRCCCCAGACSVCVCVCVCVCTRARARFHMSSWRCAVRGGQYAPARCFCRHQSCHQTTQHLALVRPRRTRLRHRQSALTAPHWRHLLPRRRRLFMAVAAAALSKQWRKLREWWRQQRPSEFRLCLQRRRRRPYPWCRRRLRWRRLCRRRCMRLLLLLRQAQCLSWRLGLLRRRVREW